MTSDPQGALITQYEKTISRLDLQNYNLRRLLKDLRDVVSGAKSRDEMKRIIGEVDSVIE